MPEWYEISNAADIPSPTLLLYPARIEQNLQRMISMAGGVSRLRPHVKTHKLPQIIAMKRAAGIDKFKVSTIAEAEMTAAAGGEDILLAYQPIGPNVERLVELMRRFPKTHFSTLVDDPRNLERIGKVATSHNVVIPLYLDLNVGMTAAASSRATQPQPCTAPSATRQGCRQPACMLMTVICAMGTLPHWRRSPSRPLRRYGRCATSCAARVIRCQG